MTRRESRWRQLGGGPRSVGMLGTSVVFSIGHGDIPAVPTSAWHGPRPVLNGSPFNQVLAGATEPQRRTNMDDTPHDDADIARLFREHDDIGPDSSLWLRPLRQLFNDGKPIGQIIAITVSPMKQQIFPFGMITQTMNNRLVFWPILPSGVNMICAGERVDVFDHITLEFPSEKIHVTTYDADGRPIHVARSWRTHRFSDCDLALWFTLLVRVSLLGQQDMAVQRRVQMPTTDQDRRIDEFVRYTQNISVSNVALPPADGECDYIYCGVYLAKPSIIVDQLPSSILPADSTMDSVIEGWPDGNVFQLAVSRLSIGQHTICIAAACPPGKLRSDVSVGLPGSVNSES